MDIKDYAIDRLSNRISSMNLRIIELEFINNELSEKIKELESSDKDNKDNKDNKELRPITEDEFDDTPKTGYPEDIELGDLKNQYLIIRRYGICSKKYVMKNICIALSIVGIIFSAGLVLLRGRK